mmetsp:Transcript_34699/g.78341  ORF Transcript_34699/g.78341 Transcript_34699/m.78341 type:complete len:336 (+) Transcript_34699:123-1130(+)|eukprot:768397-Hanusia_phi.AAC.11
MEECRLHAVCVVPVLDELVHLPRNLQHDRLPRPSLRVEVTRRLLLHEVRQPEDRARLEDLVHVIQPLQLDLPREHEEHAGGLVRLRKLASSLESVDPPVPLQDGRKGRLAVRCQGAGGSFVEGDAALEESEDLEGAMGGGERELESVIEHGRAFALHRDADEEGSLLVAVLEDNALYGGERHQDGLGVDHRAVDERVKDDELGEEDDPHLRVLTQRRAPQLALERPHQSLRQRQPEHPDAVRPQPLLGVLLGEDGAIVEGLERGHADHVQLDAVEAHGEEDAEGLVEAARLSCRPQPLDRDLLHVYHCPVDLHSIAPQQLPVPLLIAHRSTQSLR